MQTSHSLEPLYQATIIDLLRKLDAVADMMALVPELLADPAFLRKECPEVSRDLRKVIETTTGALLVASMSTQATQAHSPSTTEH